MRNAMAATASARVLSAPTRSADGFIVAGPLQADRREGREQRRMMAIRR